MKFSVFTLCLIVCGVFVHPAQAQVHVIQRFDKSVYEAAKKGPEALFERLAAGDLGGFGISEDSELPPDAVSEGLFVRGFGCFATQEGEVLYRTEGVGSNLFPGDIFAPKDIRFPAKLGRDLQAGTYLIFFEVKADNPEHDRMLRKRPGRAKFVTFTVE